MEQNSSRSLPSQLPWGPGPGHLGPGCSLLQLLSPGLVRGMECLGSLGLALFRERHKLRAHLAPSIYPEGARESPSKDQ